MRARQRGLATVEFAIAGGLAIAVLIASIEVLRAFFVMSALGEGTRRAARQAVVCPMNDAAVKDALLSMPGAAIPALAAANITVNYLTAAGGTTSDPDDASFVQVQITGYTLSLLIPKMSPDDSGGPLSITLPPFRTTLPVESLGYLPDSGGFGCPGT